MPQVIKHCQCLHTWQAAHTELSWEVSSVSLGRHGTAQKAPALLRDAGPCLAPLRGCSGKRLIGGCAPAQLHAQQCLHQPHASGTSPQASSHTYAHSGQRTLSFQNLMNNSENQQQGCTAWHLLLPAYLKNKCCHSQREEASIPADSRRPWQLPQECQVLP